MRMTLIFICLFLVLQGLFCTSIAAQPQHLDDREITLAVATELSIDDSVPAHFIDVKTENGIVVLSGMVDNLLAREQARKRAELVKGVKAVVNNIEVKPVERRDATILTDVKQALLTDPATDAYEVRVRVDEGIVTLSGMVESWQEKQLSTQVARSIKGVKTVKNEISIRSQAQRLDHEIAMDIKRRLAADVWIDDILVTVDVQDGNVTLKGIVGSAMEKSRAVDIARAAGVQSVDASRLEVRVGAQRPLQRTQTFTPKTDDEIERAILAAFYQDPRVSTFNPRVEVEEGVVTLTGKVDNLATKQAAAEDAQNTVGVKRVRNHLRVRPEKVPDNTDLANRVRLALSRDVYVERYEILVTALNGRVYLAGTVNSLFEKTHAGRVASRVNGVVTVVNNLQTLPKVKQQSDWEIQLDVERLLSQSPLLDRETITVAVEDGMATLSGTVETPLAHDAAIAKAYEAGARGVRDRLKVVPNDEDLGS